MRGVADFLIGGDFAYLRGLWWSGLRLCESLALEWTGTTPGALVVDFTGRRPMLRIPAESEKGGQDRLLPMAPEFAEFLQETPGAERHGRVFRLAGRRWPAGRMQGDWVSRVVCRIGRKARVVVDQRERRLVVDASAAKAKRRKNKADDDGVKRKYASAHDLRRAFGLRWSARVMPAVLQQLMRHEDISTTMRYYVGRDADAVADTLWQAVESVTGKDRGNKTANIDRDSHSESAEEKPQTLMG
jgi:integrase